MQDLEFTVEDRKLYMLQTRNGKRTAKASVQIAVDMVKEGLVSEKEGKYASSSREFFFFFKCTDTHHRSSDPYRPTDRSLHCNPHISPPPHRRGAHELLPPHAD